MKTTRFIFAWLLLSCTTIFSQTVNVYDKTTRVGIPGVRIYSNNPQLITSTDNKGSANISAFSQADSVFFIYTGYKTEVFTFTQLQENNFKVELTESNISLTEVVVSASRWEDQQTEIPYKVEKINLKEAAFQNTQTSADLLGSGGFAYIQKSQLAGGSPMLRGFATNRVMLVVDGVRMNNAIFRSGNLQNVISIDASSLESTEILFGPGAVMYGSDAIGGVMDFHTLKPKFTDSSRNMTVNGNAYVRYSSANNEKTGHIDLNIGLKKLAFATGITYSDFEDLRSGSIGNNYYLRPTYVKTINGVDTQLVNNDPTLQIGSAYNQLNLLQKIRYSPNKHWNIEYGFYYSTTSNAGRYDRLILDANNNGTLDYAEWYYGPQKWMMNRVAVTHTKSTVLYDNIRFTAGLQNYEESRHDRKFNNTKIRHQVETVDALSLNLDLDRRINEKFTLFYGTEYIHNTVGSAAERVNIESGEVQKIASRYPDGSTWQTIGVYSNMKYKVDKDFILNAGLRYSYFNIHAEFDTTLFPLPFTTANNKNGSLNGSVGVVIMPDTNFQIYLNASTGFRSPNIDDIGKVFESSPGAVVVPNANLKPEYAYSGEIGFAKSFGNTFKMELNSYYTHLDNALDRRNYTFNGQDSIWYEGELSRVEAVQNVAKAFVYGFQAVADLYFGKGFALSGKLTWQKGKEQSEDSLIYYPLRHVPPMFGSTHLTYRRKFLKLDLYANYKAKMDFEDLALTERADPAPYAKNENGLPHVPAWCTINFKIGLYFNKYFSFNAGIENITDQLYRPYASGITAPGRNFIVSLRYKL